MEYSHTFQIHALSMEVQCTSELEVEPVLLEHLSRAFERTFKHVPITTIRALFQPTSEYLFNVSLVSEKQIQTINHEFLGKNKPTDVLSFSRLESEVLFSPWDAGDLLICWEICKAQAAKIGHSEIEELERLTVHGTLHLLGYEHENDSLKAKEMFALQETILLDLIKP